LPFLHYLFFSQILRGQNAPNQTVHLDATPANIVIQSQLSVKYVQAEIPVNSVPAETPNPKIARIATPSLLMGQNQTKNATPAVQTAEPTMTMAQKQQHTLQKTIPHHARTQLSVILNKIHVMVII